MFIAKYCLIFRTKLENIRLKEELGSLNLKLEETGEILKQQAQDLRQKQEHQSVHLDSSLQDIKGAVGSLQMAVDSGVERADSSSETAVREVARLAREVEGLKEEMWELDTNNRNNLVFYGIREEAASTAEASVRDIIRR